MASLSVTPELRLCLLLARGELSPAARERARELLALPLQWPRVLQFAYAQQVLPLMYQNLTRLGFPGVPHSVEAELRHASGTNALRNSLLARELARLLALLDEAGIPAIPLKGVALAEALYGDSGLRVCSDIDILVPAKNFADAFVSSVPRGTDPRSCSLPCCVWWRAMARIASFFRTTPNERIR